MLIMYITLKTHLIMYIGYNPLYFNIFQAYFVGSSSRMKPVKLRVASAGTSTDIQFNSIDIICRYTV